MFSKEEWSILQSVEFRYRNSLLGDHLLLKEESGKHLAGVISANGVQRLWILLDPEQEPFIKQLPKGDYRISESEFEKILSFRAPHPEVLAVIKKSVRADSNINIK